MLIMDLLYFFMPVSRDTDCQTLFKDVYVAKSLGIYCGFLWYKGHMCLLPIIKYLFPSLSVPFPLCNPPCRYYLGLFLLPVGTGAQEMRQK